MYLPVNTFESSNVLGGPRGCRDRSGEQYPAHLRSRLLKPTMSRKQSHTQFPPSLPRRAGYSKVVFSPLYPPVSLYFVGLLCSELLLPFC